MNFSPDSLCDLVRSGAECALHTRVLECLFDEAADVAFFIKDREGRYLSINQSLAERHGFASKEKVLGKRPSEVCPGPFGQVPTEQDEKVLKTGRPLTNHLEMQWLHPNRPCWCLTTKLPLFDQAGTIIGLAGFSRDVREPVPLDDVPAKLALALEAFEKSCGEKTASSSLAAQAGMSPSRFARLMKRLFGVTPSQYISKIRINAAARLLRETDESVSSIAIECGFSDHSAFTRAFRAAMGLTPSEFRDEVNAA